MAKIKIRGYAELIQVSQQTALEIKGLLDRGEKDALVGAGEWFGKVSDVSFVMMDNETNQQDDTVRQALTDYYQKRNEILLLSPRVRAEKTSWKYFSLFYFGVKKESPPDSMKQGLFQKCEEFFKQNTNWSKPSLKVFIDFLQLPNDFSIDSSVFRVLEQVEQRELIDSNATK